MPQLSLHSPVGDITVSAEDGLIVALDWGWGRDQTETPLLLEAIRQLNAYFDGGLRSLDLPLALPVTSRRRALAEAIARIPYGETTTYGALARGLQSSARAVGQACAQNPLPILIPCHRVLGAEGRLTHYSGGDGVATKAVLLRMEGALLS